MIDNREGKRTSGSVSEGALTPFGVIDVIAVIGRICEERRWLSRVRKIMWMALNPSMEKLFCY